MSKIDDRLRKWSHSFYRLLIATSLCSSIRIGEQVDVSQILFGVYSEGDLRNSFVSSLRDKEVKRDSIRYTPNARFKDNVLNDIARLAFIDLVVLFDDLSAEILQANGFVNVPSEPGSKAAYVKKIISERAPEKLWSANGLIELMAIRNTVVHNGCVWNERSIDLLKQANIPDTESRKDVPFPQVGDQFNISLSDVLKYRRAIRTALNVISAFRAAAH